MSQPLRRASWVSFVIIIQTLRGMQSLDLISLSCPPNFTAHSDFNSPVTHLLYKILPKRRLFNSSSITKIYPVILLILWERLVACTYLNVHFLCYHFFNGFTGTQKKRILDRFYHLDHYLFFRVIITYNLLMKYQQPP